MSGLWLEVVTRTATYRTSFQSGSVVLGPLELELEVTDDRWSGRLQNTGTESVELREMIVSLPPHRQRWFDPGWQSWSRALVQPVPRSGGPSWTVAHLHGHPERIAAGRRVADHFTVLETGPDQGILIGLVDGSHHTAAYDFDETGLAVVACFGGSIMARGSERRIGPFIRIGPGPVDVVIDAYMHEVAREMEARPSRSLAGWSPDKASPVTVDEVRRAVGVLALDTRDAVFVGDGHSTGLETDASNADLLALLAEEGYRAGSWWAPAVTASDGLLASTHPDWLLRGWQWPADDGTSLVPLDVSHPGVLRHLTETAAWFHRRGVSVHRLDLLSAACLPGPRHRPELTRVEAYREALAAIRRGAGDDAYLIGDGAPLLPSVGLLDAVAVSAGLNADRSLTLRHRIPVDALATVLNRTLFQGRWWSNDPGPILLNPDGAGLRPDELATMALTAVVCGGVFLGGDRPTSIAGADLSAWARLRHVWEEFSAHRPRPLRLWNEGPTRVIVNPLADSWGLLVVNLRDTSTWESFGSGTLTMEPDEAEVLLGRALLELEADRVGVSDLRERSAVLLRLRGPTLAA